MPTPRPGALIRIKPATEGRSAALAICPCGTVSQLTQIKDAPGAID
jgi:hypothetical protein